MHTKFWLQILKGRDHLEDLTVSGIKMNMEIEMKDVDWIHLAQDRDWWLALMNIV
jgi:hypothetical protein